MKQQSLWEVLRDPDCKRCPLHESAQYVCLIGRGPHPCKYMLIGEAPGFREDDIGKPFAGRAGELLDRVLEYIKISRSKVYITNIGHCRPPGNKKPNHKQMDACRYWLEKEIEAVKPEIIILMGKSAVYGLFRNDDLSIEEMRGKRYKYKDGIKAYVTYHPAAALRRPFLEKVIKKDFLRIFTGTVKKKEEKDVDYNDLDNKSLDQMIESPPETLAVDVETPEGLIFYKHPITCLSVSPKARVSRFVENPRESKKKLKRLLENTTSVFIGHNLKYDLKSLVFEDYISEKSLITSKLFCTKVAFNVLDENYLDKSLEHLADMFTSMGRWKDDRVDFSDSEKLRMRNLKDTDATKRLYNVFMKKLVKHRLLIPFKIDMDVMKVLVSAEIHGIRLDIDTLNDLDIELTKEIAKLKKLIPVEKPNSTKQLTEMFTSMGIKSHKETENGAPSWDKSVLQELSSKLQGTKKKLIDHLIEWKKYFGIKTKFLNSLPEFMDSQRVIHPVFNQTKALSDDGDEEGTVTGRLSCKNPNLMQIPRDKEEVPQRINPRRLFVPTHRNGFICTADYDQIEVRIAAHDANDKKLINILTHGEDIHRFVAAEVLRKPANKITTDERKQIKKVVFGIRYRISARGLSEKIGVSEERAKRLILFFFQAFPRQEERIIEIEDLIIREEEISNMFGRVRRLPGATDRTAIGRALIRQGVNFPIQGGAVDIVKIAMYRIWKEILVRGLRTRIFANVHDAIDSDGYPGEEKEVVEIVKYYMENPGLEEYGVKLKVPLRATIKIGPNWLETTTVN